MVPSTLFCTNCGTPNRQESLFCFACGQPLQTSVDDPSRPFPGMNASALQYASARGNFPPRSMLKQRYRILARVGNGGFGAVYKAEDTLIGNRLVAVKEMNRGGIEEQGMESATAAFKREALLLANLKHPSLPRFYDHFTEASHWYLVMEYIEGETLEMLLEKLRRFRVEDVLRIGYYLSDVLNYLHLQRPPVVFRDLKPANIIMTPRGQIYLIDFGLARLFDPALTGQFSSFGSPGYAAPEQYESMQTTVSVDIYSLGATLHHMLTGIQPAIKPFEFAPIRFAPGTPLADLGTLIERMLALSPSHRPESMTAVLGELQRIANQVRRMRAASGGRTTPTAPQSRPFSSSGSGLVAPPIGTLLCRFEGHQDAVNGLAWSSNGAHLVSVGSDGAARLWNTTTATPLITYQSEHKQARAVAWSPDGSRIAIGYAGDKRDVETMHIILVTTGERIFTYSGGGSFWNAQDDRSIYTLAWSPDGARIAWGGGSNRVEVWDAQMRRQLAVYKGHNSAVYSLAWSPDGRQIVSCGADDAVHIWDASTGRNAATFFKHSSVVTSVAWSSNGQRVATASHDRMAQVWNAVTGTTLTTYRRHSDQLLAISWSPNGSFLATASRDGQAHIWDATRGVTSYIYTGHVGSVSALLWSPDGKHIASAGSDQVVHVWRAV